MPSPASPRFASRPAAWRLVLSSSLCLALSACGDSSPPPPPAGEMGPPPAGDGAPPQPLVKMEARGLFFAGQIEVESLLAPGGMHWGARGKEGKDGPHRGGGGFRMGGGGMGGGGPGGGGRRGRMGGDDDGPRSVMRASNLPPVQLRLRLTNHGSVPAPVEVLDFNSEIGNFVVQPDKLLLAPGESIEAEPMISRLGVPGNEVPLTVRLRLTGRTEQQILTLKLLPPPPAEKPADAP